MSQEKDCMKHYMPHPCAQCGLEKDIEALKERRGIHAPGESVTLYDEKQRRQVMASYTDVAGRRVDITVLPGDPDLIGRLIQLEQTVMCLQSVVNQLQTQLGSKA